MYRPRQSVPTRQIATALRRKKCSVKKYAIRVEHSGEGRQVGMFDFNIDLLFNVTGRLQFWHYRTKVLTVDFDKTCLTDHGARNVSRTTDRRITEWLSAIEYRMYFVHAETNKQVDIRSVTMACATVSSDWWLMPDDDLRRYARRRNGAAVARTEAFIRFRNNAPWIVKDEAGDLWYYPERYSSLIHTQYKEVARFLEDNWRWYTGRWEPDGTYGYCFIDEAAQKRWKARQKRVSRKT